MKNVIMSLVLTLLIFVGGAFAQTHTHVLTVVNGSSETITQLYISPSSYGTWGNDRLGDDVMSPNTSRTATERHSTYDFKSVKYSGKTCTILGILLDRDKTVTVVDGRCSVSDTRPTYDYY